MPHFCYLLRSLSSPTSRASYIGYSTDPHQRLRQHNGEVKAGAYHTSKRRPWVHVVVVAGFPSKVLALQFEWQWQHPDRSRLWKTIELNATVLFKCTNGYKAKLTVLGHLLALPVWQQLRLQIHLVDPTQMAHVRKLLGQNQHISLLESTPADVHALGLGGGAVAAGAGATGATGSDSSALTCCICFEACQGGGISSGRLWRCLQCHAGQHVHCLGQRSLSVAAAAPDAAAETAGGAEEQSLSMVMVPAFGECGQCQALVRWMQVVQQSFLLGAMGNAAAAEEDEDGQEELDEGDGGDQAEGDTDDGLSLTQEEPMDLL